MKAQNTITVVGSALTRSQLADLFIEKQKDHAFKNSIYQSLVDGCARARGAVTRIDSKVYHYKQVMIDLNRSLARSKKPETIENKRVQIEKASRILAKYQTRRDQASVLLASKEAQLREAAAERQSCREALSTLEAYANVAEDLSSAKSNTAAVTSGNEFYQVTHSDFKMNAEYINALETVREKQEFIAKVIHKGIIALKDGKGFGSIIRSLSLMLRSSNTLDPDDFWTAEFKRVRAFIHRVTPYDLKIKSYGEGDKRVRLILNEDKEWAESIPTKYWIAAPKASKQKSLEDKFMDKEKELKRIDKLNIDPDMGQGAALDLGFAYLRRLGLDHYFDLVKAQKDMMGS